MEEARTTYTAFRAVVVRHRGDIVATGRATVAVTAADFYGDQGAGTIQDLRIDELHIPSDDDRFDYWNSLVGRTIDPNTIEDEVYLK